MVHECNNCGGVFPESELVIPIPHLESRIEAGGTVPSGECPECGCLCYPKEAKSLKRQFWLLTYANHVPNFGATVERQTICPTRAYAIRIAREWAGRHEKLKPDENGVLFENDDVLIFVTRLA